MDEHTNQGELVVAALRRTLALAPDEPVPTTITVEQAANVIGISRGLAYKAVRLGQIPSIRFGQHERKKILVPVSKLLRALGEPPASENGDGDPRSISSFRERVDGSEETAK
jgi:excisionase family DNA binding protein